MCMTLDTIEQEKVEQKDEAKKETGRRKKET